MASALHRITKQYLTSVNTPEFSSQDWIINPDLSAVQGFEPKYWLITGDVVTVMSSKDRDEESTTLRETQDRQIASLRRSADANALLGFSSNATGTIRVYGAEDEDCLLLLEAIVVTQGGGSVNFPCLDANTRKPVFPVHTNAQLRQVVADGLNIKGAIITQLRQLIQDVRDAQKVSAVLAITWTPIVTGTE